MKTYMNAAIQLTHFIHPEQMSAIMYALNGEEADYFKDKLVELTAIVEKMPKSYETDGQGDGAIAYLHYFYGGYDWYITEKDLGCSEDKPSDRGKQFQAFGLANMDYPELGYICIEEMITGKNVIELDLHFTPQTLKKIKSEKGW